MGQPVALQQRRRNVPLGPRCSCQRPVRNLLNAAGAFEAISAAAAPAPGELIVNALKVSVNFAKETGAVRLKATLKLPEDFNPVGAAVAIDVCGATTSLMLDRRSRGKGINGGITMKHSRSEWSLSASLKNLTWPNQWTEVGIEDWKNFKGAVEMPVTVIVGSATYTGSHSHEVKSANGR